MTKTSATYEIYKVIRKEIDRLKKKVGFSCKQGGSCCTRNIKVFIYDYLYMREKNVDTSGLELSRSEDGFIHYIDMNWKGESRFNTGVCYYENGNQCSIHPYNPIICHSFPFVWNIRYSQDRDFFIQKSCTWMEENFAQFKIKIKDYQSIKNLISCFWIAAKYEDNDIYYE
jgi:Fe-S-cluster containining protein